MRSCSVRLRWEPRCSMPSRHSPAHTFAPLLLAKGDTEITTQRSLGSHSKAGAGSNPPHKNENNKGTTLGWLGDGAAMLPMSLRAVRSCEPRHRTLNYSHTAEVGPGWRLMGLVAVAVCFVEVLISSSEQCGTSAKWTAIHSWHRLKHCTRKLKTNRNKSPPYPNQYIFRLKRWAVSGKKKIFSEKWWKFLRQFFSSQQQEQG